MANTLPGAQLLKFGSEKFIFQNRDLRAGPLSALLQDADLRYLKVGNTEIVRRIYMALRDRNWNTVPAAYSDWRVDRVRNSFSISFIAHHKNAEVDFTWKGSLIGTSNGSISYSMEGLANGEFYRSRIGLCLLLPIEGFAGKRIRISRVDGTTASAAVPFYISAKQPLTGFTRMRRMELVTRHGASIGVTLLGDAFEMEDQRNWTDGSFKVYSTPLAQPVPVLIRKGEKVVQSIRIDVIAGGPSVSQREIRFRPVKIRVGGKSGRFVPRIGLGVASHDSPISALQFKRLRALNLSHLRVDLDLQGDLWSRELEKAVLQAREIGISLQLAAFVSEDPEPEIKALRDKLEAMKPKVESILIFPSKGQRTDPRAARLAKQFLQDYQSGLKIGGGTNINFFDLNQDSHCTRGLSMVCYSVNPQVHASDVTSLFETFEGQVWTVKSARRLVGKKAIAVTPVTLRPRFNPDAVSPDPPAEPGQLPSQVDPRQSSLVGAVWTAGSLKALVESGVDVLTFYETTGWRGVMETGDGSQLPTVFLSKPNAVFPLYYVIGDIAHMSGGEVRSITSSEPHVVDALATLKNGRERVLIFNLTPEIQAVQLAWPTRARMALRRLNEYTVADASDKWDSFTHALHGMLKPNEGPYLTLFPYEVLRLDGS